MAYIEMKHSFKRYQVGESEIVANHDISFEIEKGELVIILGAWDWGQAFGRAIVQKLGGDEPFVGARFEAEIELGRPVDKEILFQSPIKGDLLGFAFK